MIDRNDKINHILNNKDFRNYLKKNKKFDKKSEFCNHNLEHFINVARIAYIINLEKSLGFKKEVIYGAALLHDIGKWTKNISKEPHSQVSARLALEILEDSGYEETDISIIISAIKGHSTNAEDDGGLNYLLYYSDKKSRNCFCCKASNHCNWDETKKNHGIIY